MPLPSEPPLKAVPDRRQDPSVRRRSVRVELELPVVVKWVGQDGSPQQEIGKTKVVNAHGCLLLMKARVVEGLAVEVVNRENQEVRKGHVVCCLGVQPDGRTQVGLELEDPDPEFWGQRYTQYLVWQACNTR